MLLSDLIIEYRNRFNISQRAFAEKCGLSNTYISFIENEHNPKTGKPITPTIEQYAKLAKGMDISLHQLFESIDNAPIVLNNDCFSDDEIRLVHAYRAADDRAREDALKTLLDHPRKKDIPLTKAK
ncbi:MAG: helix-turn-helix transcriptional regulator [Clostridium sp.]|nr:helix-turn-helix transcriptional regulator [Clostridium sp.]